MELELVIRRVLLDDWDPLDIRSRVDEREAAARYDCQVQDVTLLVLGDASDDDLAEYLRGAEEVRLGLGSVDEPRLARVVAALRRVAAARAAAGRAGARGSG